MAVRSLVTSLAGARWAAGLVQHSSSSAVPPACLQQLHSHAGRLTNPWEEVLRVAKSNPEKLHEVVNTLTHHCIKAQAAPPLETYNELLRICELHSDLASVHKLCQMACAVRMHLDHTTYDRLQAVYSYFPKPFTSTAAKGSFAGRDGLGPSTAAQHAGPSTEGSAADEGAGRGPAGRGARTGAILEAPPTSSIPSISTTGGASSVSASSSLGGFGGSARPGAGKISTTQTNVWAASTGVTSTQLEAWRREREQASSSSSGGGGAGGVNSSGATSSSTTASAPDAAA